MTRIALRMTRMAEKDKSGAFQLGKWWYPHSWMVYDGKTHLEMDDIWGSTPILGHLHIKFDDHEATPSDHDIRAQVTVEGVSAPVITESGVSWMKSLGSRGFELRKKCPSPVLFLNSPRNQRNPWSFLCREFPRIPLGGMG